MTATQQDATLLTLPDKPYWAYETCAICGKGFTEQTWDERHSFLYDREKDVHARCCTCLGKDHGEVVEDTRADSRDARLAELTTAMQHIRDLTHARAEMGSVDPDFVLETIALLAVDALAGTTEPERAEEAMAI